MVISLIYSYLYLNVVIEGLHYDLKSLTRVSNQQPYFIKDGDIPCTPEVEPTFSYVWNFCDEVPSAWLPSLVCDPVKYHGAAIQYLDRSDGYKECHVIGRYDSTQDDIHYKLIDEKNPVFGISMTYPMGESCPNDKLRSATIDVECANVDFAIVSTQEPEVCAYHMQVRSYHGCPTVFMSYL
jgi:hypothetical protein